MPMQYRGHDAEMRRLVRLSRSIDRQLASEKIHWTQQRARQQDTARTPQAEATCCDDAAPRYDASTHSMVCARCGVSKSLGFEEFNESGKQIEQRIACDMDRKVPYSRIKHFKKVLRDVTRAGSRVPSAILERVRAALGGEVATRDSVRAVLREAKLYHYYTAENYIACVLGDRTRGVQLTGGEQQQLLRDAMSYSTGFDRLRAREKTTRRNFVNVQVLMHYVFQRTFKRDISALLRMPSARICEQNRKLIGEIEREMLFQAVVVTPRARLHTTPHETQA